MRIGRDAVASKARSAGLRSPLLLLMLVLLSLPSPGEIPGLWSGSADGEALARRKRRRPKRRPPPPAPAPAAEASSVHRDWVIKTYGRSTLEALKQAGIPAKTFWYANQNAIAGIKRMRKGKHADGFYLLTKAYKLVPSPNILYHLARANEAIGRLVQARTQLARFLATAPEWQVTKVSEKDLADARSRLDAVKGRLVELEVKVNEAEALLFVDNRLRGRSPFKQTFWVLPNRPISVVLLKPGYQRVEKTLRFLRSGVKQTLNVEMLTTTEAVKRHKRYVELQERLRLERLTAERKAKARRDALRISGWSLLGAGAASLILGSVFAVLGEVEYNKVIQVLPGTPWPDVEANHRRSVAYRTTSYVTLGAGAAMGISGALLLYYGYRQQTRERDASAPAGAPVGHRLLLAPELGPGQVGLRFSGSF